jgi:hypothetical protein
MPALACWTVAYAIQKVGHVPVFVEVDEAWAMQDPPVRTDAAVVIDPWGSAANWDVAGEAPVRILDATQSPGAGWHGRRAVEAFDAAILSFGTAKPICLHGGGVALFRDGHAAREARQLMSFGIERGRWTRAIDRYTFCPWLHAPLADVLERELAALAPGSRRRPYCAAIRFPAMRRPAFRAPCRWSATGSASWPRMWSGRPWPADSRRAAIPWPPRTSSRRGPDLGRPPRAPARSTSVPTCCSSSAPRAGCPRSTA